jgi:hypothetical protein
MPPNYQRLAFVTVLDPAQLKDRANRKIEHVHSKREYFRRKRLKSMQQARDEADGVPSKPKEIAINLSQSLPAYSPRKHSPSDRCSELDRELCLQCRNTTNSVIDEEVLSQSSSSSAFSPTVVHADLVDGNLSSFVLSLHHQTNILNAGSIDPFGTFPVRSNPEIALLMDSFVSNCG